MALQDDPFTWSVKYNSGTEGFRFTTKVVVKDYTLRYYNSKTGWIATSKGMDIQLYKLQETTAE